MSVTARGRAIRWAVPERSRGRRVLATVVGVALAVPALLVGFLWADAAVKWTASNTSLQPGEVDRARTQRWQNPPTGAGTRAFRWGVNEAGPPSPGDPFDYEAWLPYYDDLGVDLVRLFVGWMYYQPDGPGTPLSENYPSDQRLHMFQDAGLGVQLVPYQTPRWGASGGWTAAVSPKHVFAFSRPEGHELVEGPYNEYLAALHERFPAIDVWQIWNEPDYPRAARQAEWNPAVDSRTWRGSAREYGEMVAASTERIHGLGPDEVASTSGPSDPVYLADVLGQPGLEAVDVFDVHFAAGRGRPDPDREIDRLLAVVGRIDEVLAEAGVTDPDFSVSELSFAWSAEVPEEEAQFLARAYAVGKALQWDSMSWFTLAPTHPSWYQDTGLVHHAGVNDGPAPVGVPFPVRPAYEAYRASSRILKSLEPAGLLGDGDNVRIAAFRGPGDGMPVWLAWSARPTGSTVTWPADAGHADLLDVRGAKVGEVAPGQQLALSPDARYVIPREA